MITLCAVITGIGINWEAVALDAAMLIVLYALLYMFEKRGDEERKYACFYAGAFVIMCMVIAYAVTVGMPKLCSLLN